MVHRVDSKSASSWTRLCAKVSQVFGRVTNRIPDAQASQRAGPYPPKVIASGLDPHLPEVLQRMVIDYGSIHDWAEDVAQKLEAASTELKSMTSRLEIHTCRDDRSRRWFENAQRSLARLSSDIDAILAGKLDWSVWADDLRLENPHGMFYPATEIPSSQHDNVMETLLVMEDAQPGERRSMLEVLFHFAGRDRGGLISGALAGFGNFKAVSAVPEKAA